MSDNTRLDQAIARLKIAKSLQTDKHWQECCPKSGEPCTCVVYCPYLPPLKKDVGVMCQQTEEVLKGVKKLKERIEEARKSAVDAQKREPNGYSSAYWRGHLDGLIIAAGIFGIDDI